MFLRGLVPVRKQDTFKRQRGCHTQPQPHSVFCNQEMNVSFPGRNNSLRLEKLGSVTLVQRHQVVPAKFCGAF